MNDPLLKTLTTPPDTKPPEIITDTVSFWRGEFGTEYTDRNRVNWRDRVEFWRHIRDVARFDSYLDVGCNAGWNMLAMRELDSEIQGSGVDVNMDALEQAGNQGFDVHNIQASGVADFFGHGCAGIVITSGVLIHIAHQDLRESMQALVDVSAQYVIAIEYAADYEQEVEYRGHRGKLWKRPYGQLYQDLGLSLIEHGPAQGFDDCYYWLLEKGC